MIDDRPWYETEEGRAFAKKAQCTLPKMIGDASIFLAIHTGDEPDAKFAVELGMGILLDKPILIISIAGRPIPEHLRRVADEIVEVEDVHSGEAKDAVSDALRRMLEQLEPEQ